MITEQQVFNKFEQTVGSSQHLLEAMTLQKWLLENKESIDIDYYPIVYLACRKYIEERRETFLHKINTNKLGYIK